ncbi:restriction endonuclease subunit S [bacterium 1XD42-8]|nr:restriction endonuclease subunit S [bacterium 1XD42-8]
MPESWEYIRLNDIGEYRKGPFGSSLTKNMFVPKGANTVKVYEQKNAIQKDFVLGAYYIRQDYYEAKMKGFTVCPGDIIVSCAGTIGETYVMPKNIELGIINQALMRMRIFAPINIEYFLLYFDYVIKQQARKNSKGSAIKNIPPFEVFKQILLPLPPISEQKRIVARVHELFSICDQL